MGAYRPQYGLTSIILPSFPTLSDACDADSVISGGKLHFGIAIYVAFSNALPNWKCGFHSASGGHFGLGPPACAKVFLYMTALRNL